VGSTLAGSIVELAPACAETEVARSAAATIDLKIILIVIIFSRCPLICGTGVGSTEVFGEELKMLSEVGGEILF
jgi:hypothetical protein